MVGTVVKKKGLTKKVPTVVRNDPRYRPEKVKKATMPENGNPLLNPNTHPGAIPKSARKGMTAKQMTNYVRNQKGFSTGLKKHDRNNILVNKIYGDDKDNLTKKVTSNSFKVSSKAARARMIKPLKDNGSILSISSMEISASLKGITDTPNHNDMKTFSNVKQIGRREKIVMRIRPDERIKADTRKPVSLGPQYTKHDKKHYRTGRVKKDPNAHHPFYIPPVAKANSREGKHLDVTDKVNHHNPTGVKIKPLNPGPDMTFGGPVPDRRGNRRNIMGTYSQIDFSKFGPKVKELHD